MEATTDELITIDLKGYYSSCDFPTELCKPEPIEHMDINITTHEARERLNKIIDAVNWLVERSI